MDWFQFLRWVGAGVGGASTAFAVVYLFANNIVVSGKTYDAKCGECARERERAERAEQRLVDTLPVLGRAYEQISRAPVVAEKAVETVKTVVGGNSR